MLLLLVQFLLLVATGEGYALPKGRQSRRNHYFRKSVSHKLTSFHSWLSASSSSSSWDDFDYLQHWYPVSWACDIKLNRPTQVSLFDIPYAVAITKTNDTLSVLAYEDRCPHRGAALSEGRVTETGYLQCAYHGWSFDQQGKCVQIPQSPAKSSQYSTRACAKAVPAILHQGLVWLWPGPVTNNDVTLLPSPPSVPEMDDPAFKVTRTVRDFPCIDWTLLLSNIMDPDHGMFAHQASPFDMYSASPEYQMQVEQSFDSAGWQMISKVPAQEKLRNRDRILRGLTTKAMPMNITGVTTFHAATHVTISRRNEQGETSFVTAFWVCPTGTGRSRFLSAAVGKLPFSPPRWVFHIALNRFLDQDSVLVASQQPPVLSAEVKCLDENQQSMRSDAAKGGARTGLFVYQSPTDRSVRLIDFFWDATLAKAPRRSETLLAMKTAGLLESIPPRKVVLDRKVQHLDICPDSQNTVRNCEFIKQTSLVVTAAWVVRTFLNKNVNARMFWWIPVLFSGAGWSAEWIRKQFYYNHSEANRDRDLKSIPKRMWLDPK
ncbi:hypothetical protein FisN_24Hh053 [Fistulifera solaris]|uniref:Rieske domain-containing protein n=1 Tax=Fistulifera solaris TaxID=1519565 RepID=A0A1Z5JET2_FISSO|nr:hypothetical protein FisN_24Hh053 [Fistulifera solaris]|eukprot:GAX12479.1 hypothetical protein FisN_24Hh053 [Fistulifera solaris]